MGTKSNMIGVLIIGKFGPRNTQRTPDLINKMYLVSFFPVLRKVSPKFIS